jgi:hypothetical protein
VSDFQVKSSLVAYSGLQSEEVEAISFIPVITVLPRLGLAIISFIANCSVRFAAVVLPVEPKPLAIKLLASVVAVSTTSSPPNFKNFARSPRTPFKLQNFCPLLQLPLLVQQSSYVLKIGLPTYSRS